MIWKIRKLSQVDLRSGSKEQFCSEVGNCLFFLDFSKMPISTVLYKGRSHLKYLSEQLSKHPLTYCDLNSTRPLFTNIIHGEGVIGNIL